MANSLPGFVGEKGAPGENGLRACGGRTSVDCGFVSVCEFCECREEFVSAEVCVTPLTMKLTREPHFCLARALRFVLRESRGVSDSAQAREGRANGSAQPLSVSLRQMACEEGFVNGVTTAT